MSWTLTCLLLLLAPSNSAVHLEEPVPAKKDQRSVVPGTRVRLNPPAGHAAGRGFLGYQWEDSAASLMVLEMPGEYATTVAGFDEESLAKGGMKLLESSSLKLEGRDARLFLVSQASQGMAFKKWMVVTGDAKRTVLLTASFPEDLEGELPQALKQALIGAEWDPKLEVDPFAPLTWTLATPQGLRFAGSLGTTLMYTEDGEFVQKDKPASARLSVSPSMGTVNVQDAQSFAEKRWKQLPYGAGLEIELSRAFETPVRKGWEIVGKYTDPKQAVEIQVHQVILVAEGEYQIFVGQCARAASETWLPRWRECAKSWKPK